MKKGLTWGVRLASFCPGFHPAVTFVNIFLTGRWLSAGTIGLYPGPSLQYGKIYAPTGEFFFFN